MSIVKEFPLKFVQKTEFFEVKPHPQSNRMYHIEFSNLAIQKFFHAVQHISVQELEYVPYMRSFLFTGK